MPENETPHLRVLIANEKRDRLELLAQVVAGLGHDVIAREIYVDDTTVAARAYARRGSLARGYEDYFFKLFGRNGQNALWKCRDNLPTSDLTLDYMIDNMWLVGDPESVASQIRELYERVGGFGTLLWVTHDWDDADRWRRSMRLLATEVMPRLTDLA